LEALEPKARFFIPFDDTFFFSFVIIVYYVQNLTPL
jgi:hypothetical protein